MFNCRHNYTDRCRSASLLARGDAHRNRAAGLFSFRERDLSELRSRFEVATETLDSRASAVQRSPHCTFADVPRALGMGTQFFEKHHAAQEIIAAAASLPQQ